MFDCCVVVAVVVVRRLASIIRCRVISPYAISLPQDHRHRWLYMLIVTF
jgi:hypothetical protein